MDRYGQIWTDMVVRGTAQQKRGVIYTYNQEADWEWSGACGPWSEDDVQERSLRKRRLRRRVGGGGGDSGRRAVHSHLTWIYWMALLQQGDGPWLHVIV
jgi:hypothetical protein